MYCHAIKAARQDAIANLTFFQAPGHQYARNFTSGFNQFAHNVLKRWFTGETFAS